jgi:hypothetical protein
MISFCLDSPKHAWGNIEISVMILYLHYHEWQIFSFMLTQQNNVASLLALQLYSFKIRPLSVFWNVSIFYECPVPGH